MAETTTYYDIGQIRWQQNLNSSYNQKIEGIIKPYNRVEISSNLNYRDIYFDFSNNSNSVYLNSVYCVHLEIPRNRSYDMILDLLLAKKDASGTINLDNYQFVRRIRVPRKDNGDLGIDTVVLYPIYKNNSNEYDTKAGIVKKVEKTLFRQNDGVWRKNLKEGDWQQEWEDLEIGDIIKIFTSDGNNGTFDYYWKKNSDTNISSLEKIEKYTDAILTHTWNEDISDEWAVYDIVFSNKVPGVVDFNCLYLKVDRQAYEADIQYTVPEGYDDENDIYYGLFLDEHKMSEEQRCYCTELKNWIGEDNTAIINTLGKNLNTIGVWSHPDAIMAINGEEIRVGQSGYYELNNFNIYNFSMFIRGEEDKFSLDYQYKKD